MLGLDWIQHIARDLVMIDWQNRAKGEELAGRPVYPSTDSSIVLRAFYMTPLKETRVVILGQDPYPRPKHPIGLAFGVPADTDPLPSSLANIKCELKKDTGEVLTDPSLFSWARQGVLLLNTRLTVGDRPMSHAHWGWQTVTGKALELLNKQKRRIVFILWGAEARKLGEKYITSPNHHRIESAHPCKYSASRGFFGSKPFSRCNDLLEQAGAAPIIWGTKG